MSDATTDAAAAATLVADLVRDAVRLEQPDLEITPQTALIGDASALDSMKLVELCIALEDRAAEQGFEFDWTSEAAMSRLRSMFRSVASLAEEFARQAAAQR